MEPAAQDWLAAAHAVITRGRVRFPKSAEAYYEYTQSEPGWQEAAMRLRAHRRNMVLWSQSASSIGRYSAPPFARTRRIRRWIRTGALLAVVA